MSVYQVLDWSFSYVILLNLVTTQFSDEEVGGSEWLRGMSKVTQLLRGRTWVCLQNSGTEPVSEVPLPQEEGSGC